MDFKSKIRLSLIEGENNDWKKYISNSGYNGIELKPSDIVGVLDFDRGVYKKERVYFDVVDFNELNVDPEEYKINIINCNIKKLILSSDFKHVGLFGCNIESIVISSSIERLDISGKNNIEIPKFVETMKRLRVLHIWDTNIKKIENLPPNLTELQINRSEIEKIENIPQRVTRLILMGNKIERFKNVPDSVKYLNLQDNKINNIKGFDSTKHGKPSYVFGGNPLNSLKNFSILRNFLDISEMLIYTKKEFQDIVDLIIIKDCQDDLEEFIDLHFYDTDKDFYRFIFTTVLDLADDNSVDMNEYDNYHEHMIDEKIEVKQDDTGNIRDMVEKAFTFINSNI